ncbi:ATP-binding cassette domain-containing protein [Arthrobacter sp. NPDC093128]|uniref:ATP-binding cassette domain-containing protein n=1 Tax=Arthrobacter sp. NPDC093128 TaxID=3154979 RepID=UPI0034177911
MSELLRVENVTKVFSGHGRTQIRAVDGVSFSVSAGSVFGLVGESGSGKSTLVRCAMQLIHPTSGGVVFDGRDLCMASERELRSIRARIGFVLQNPVAALNPRLTIGASIAEPLNSHTKLSRQAVKSRVHELLHDVGLGEAHYDRYPHQISGGQCQRVGVARALAMSPKLVVLDEPTSALDVSVQAQILNLLQDLRQRQNLTYLIISHDLDVIRYLSDDVAVMKQGEVIEAGPADQVFDNPTHPYTQGLIAATPGHSSASRLNP